MINCEVFVCCERCGVQSEKFYSVPRMGSKLWKEGWALRDGDRMKDLLQFTCPTCTPIERAELEGLKNESL